MSYKQQKVLAIMLRTRRNKWLRFDVDLYGEITSCIQLLCSFIARTHESRCELMWPAWLTPRTTGFANFPEHPWTSLNYVAECIWIHLNAMLTWPYFLCWVYLSMRLVKTWDPPVPIRVPVLRVFINPIFSGGWPRKGVQETCGGKGHLKLERYLSEGQKTSLISL